MNDALLSLILQVILGCVILPYVLWQLTHESHKIDDKAGLFKFILVFEGLYALYFVLPDFLKLIYLVGMTFIINHKFFKLNLLQSFLTCFIFIVIFITSEIVSEMVGQIANIIIDYFTSEVDFLDSIKWALQSMVCYWMIHSFQQEFSTLIVNRGTQN